MGKSGNNMDKTKILVVLGGNLMAVRQAKHWSFKKVARMSGYDRQSLSSLEEGIQTPRYSTVLKLAKALDVSFPALFSRGFKVLPGSGGASIPHYQEDDYLLLFRTNFRRLLKNNKEKQKSIDAKTDIHESSISRILTGSNKDPLVTALYAMAESMHVDLAELFKRS